MAVAAHRGQGGQQSSNGVGLLVGDAWQDGPQHGGRHLQPASQPPANRSASQASGGSLSNWRATPAPSQPIADQSGHQAPDSWGNWGRMATTQSTLATHPSQNADHIGDLLRCQVSQGRQEAGQGRGVQLTQQRGLQAGARRGGGGAQGMEGPARAGWGLLAGERGEEEGRRGRARA
jgi:hypothetical protein